MTGLGMLDGLVYSALVLGLTGLGVIEQLLRVRPGRREPSVQQQRTMTSGGLDVMSVLFSPSYRHKVEYVEAQESRRDQPGEGAPGPDRVSISQRALPGSSFQPHSTKRRLARRP